MEKCASCVCKKACEYPFAISPPVANCLRAMHKRSAQLEELEKKARKKGGNLDSNEVMHHPV